MSYAQLAFAECPSNVTARNPVHLEWSSTQPVQIYNSQPINLALWSNASPGTHFVSRISDNITTDTYTWTPNTSLSDGGYYLELWISGGAHLYSEEVTLDQNKPDDNISSTSKLSTSSTTSLSSTTGPISSLGPFTVTPTFSSNPSALASSISQPLDAQQDPVFKHAISHRAIAGIAIGAVAFLILISASAIPHWRRHRQSSQSAIPELPKNQTDADIKSDPSAIIWVPELDQDGAMYVPHELPDTPPPLEEPLEATETNLAERRVVEIGDPE